MVTELDSKGGVDTRMLFNKLTEVIRALNAMEAANTSTNSRVMSVLVDDLMEHTRRSMGSFRDYQRWCAMYQNLHGKATS